MGENTRFIIERKKVFVLKLVVVISRSEYYRHKKLEIYRLGISTC